MSRARVGVHIDSLVAKEAVKRVADPADRRVWKVSLTRGPVAVEAAVDVNRAVRASVHQGLSDDDLDVLDRLLRTIQENVVMFCDGAG